MRITITHSPEHLKTTIGVLIIFNDYEVPIFSCSTLELPWLENEQKKSRIPTGQYKIKKVDCAIFGPTLSIRRVTGCSKVVIRSGNTLYDAKDCILVGDRVQLSSNEALYALNSSKATLALILQIIPNELELTIY